MTVFKVDLSNNDWQRGPVDIAAMAADGVQVVIHKATDGMRFYRDPYFAEAMARARKAGVVTGAYHVLWNAPDPAGQVDWFVDTVLAAAPWAASEPFEWLLDCEPFPYNGGAPGVAAINAAAARLKQRVPRHQPLAYCPRWAYPTLAGVKAPIVASNYGTNPVAHYRAAYPGDQSGRWDAYGGVTPALLQYGSKTIVGGQPEVDANAFRGSLAELHALLMPGGPPAPTPREEDDGMHVTLKPGEATVLTSNTTLGGAGWLNLSSAFGDATVRVAIYANGGWSDGKGTPNDMSALSIKDSAGHWSHKLDGSVDKVTVENRGPGLLAVDTFADRPWS